MTKILYISDLDGTLLNHSAELSAYTVSTLNKLIEKGLHFSIATARTLASSAKILSGVTLHVPVVLMNGATICDTKQKQYIKVNRFLPETIAGIIKAIKSFDTTGFMYRLKDGELMTFYESLERKSLRDFVEERMARYYKSFEQTDSFSNLPPEDIIYFTLLDTHEKLLPIHDALAVLPDVAQTFYKDNYSPDLWYLEVFSKEASKKNAVNYLRDSYGYERVVGFGDNLNDLPMFEACDVKVAVENAKPEVKAAADFICGANVADGVAKWLEENLL